MSTLFLISIFAFTIYLSWRIFGSRQKFLNYFIIYAYLSGVTFIIIGFFSLISNGYTKFFDKELFENLLLVSDKKLTFDMEWWNNKTFQVRFGIILFGYLVASLWGLIGWGAYRMMNNATKLKSFGVLIITGVFSWIALAIGLLITYGIAN